MERTRKIDVEKISEEQYQQIEANLRKKVKDTVDQTIKDLNKYLNVYGLEALMGIEIVKQGEANLIKERMKNPPQEELGE